MNTALNSPISRERNIAAHAGNTLESQTAYRNWGKKRLKASLIDYIEGLIPPPENNYMYQDKHWVAGYNQAIDDMRAKLKGKEI
jgi:hypothetical protein